MNEKDLLNVLNSFREYNDKRKERALQIAPKNSAIALHLVPLLLNYNHQRLPGFVNTDETHGGLPFFKPGDDETAAAQRYLSDFDATAKNLGINIAPRSKHASQSNGGYYGGQSDGGDYGSYGSTDMGESGGYGAYGNEKPRFARADEDGAGGEKTLIESLILMGSIGSAAQNAKSDFDYWAVVDEKKLEKSDLKYLKKKLLLIEEWGDKQGVELHFFITDLNKAQDNNFGSADKESAGSSQARLLKEEFYRTALHVSGKMPVWWATPPGANDMEYKKVMGILADSNKIPLSTFVDLGNLCDITMGEFFGAALWQINKAFDSPFKSVLKMAMLESFIDPDGNTLLLCDELKDNVRAAKSPPQALDPYLIMLSRLLDYYQKKNKPKVVELLRKCLYNKVNTKITPNTRKKSKLTFKEQMMLHYVNEWNWSDAATADLNQYEEWDFDRMLNLGSELHAFLIDTYKVLTDQLGARADSKNLISDADRTVLGRKLFSFYSKKPGKVELVKRASDDALRQESCTFMPIIVRGKKPLWALSRGNITTEVARKQNVDYAQLRKNTELTELIAWATVNQIVDTRSFMHLIPNPLPVTLTSIQQLIKLISERMPHKSISSIPNEYLLHSAKTDKLIIVVNMVTQSWVKKIEDITMISRNTHGEIFAETQSGKTALNKLVELVSKATHEAIRHPMDFFKILIPQSDHSVKLEKQMYGVVLKLLKQGSAPHI